MNYLKKKLKPLTSTLTSAATNVTSNSHNNHHKKDNTDKDLEDDLYDDYVVEAPPHPSELLALGINPSEIDANDPEKLKELYRKAKQEGKDSKTNSTLLARQRQKEEIEEKKKTREEWKFFDSITARVEQAVKESQKTLEQLKETSAVDRLTEPDYELRLTADQVFKSTSTVKLEKTADSWVDFDEEKSNKAEEAKFKDNKPEKSDVDEFGCSKQRNSSAGTHNFIVEELLDDFGLDLRTPEQKKADQLQKLKSKEATPKAEEPIKQEVDLKAAARPRPRPGSKAEGTEEGKDTDNVDPFDTSFTFTTVEPNFLLKEPNETKQDVTPGPKTIDPFDTSYINL